MYDKTEAEIMMNWNGDGSFFPVTVLCITYNHERFIGQAIDGFLKQETNFPFQILIHDDASTDATASIIRDYEKKFPNLIKVIYQTVNQYSQGVKPIKLLMDGLRTDYIALCEGDDYWVDELKLQKQYDFMCKNMDCAISFHDSMIVNQDNELVAKSKLNNSTIKVVDSEMLMLGVFAIPTQTAFFRNVIDLPFEYSRVVNEDTFIFSLLGQHGYAIHQNEIKSSVYRLHEGGVWSSKSNVLRSAQLINSYFWISSYFEGCGLRRISFYYRLKILSIALGRGRDLPGFLFFLPTFFYGKVKRYLNLAWHSGR